MARSTCWCTPAGAASKASLADTELADFRRMLDLNLVGTFLALRAGIA